MTATTTYMTYSPMFLPVMIALIGIVWQLGRTDEQKARDHERGRRNRAAIKRWLRFGK